MKILDVEYMKGNTKETISISDIGLKVFKQDIEQKGYKIISINERKPEKIPIDKEVLRKRRFYNSQYSTEIRRLNRNAISKEEYDNRIDLLKKLMKDCGNAKTYKIKYKSVYK